MSEELIAVVSVKEIRELLAKRDKLDLEKANNILRDISGLIKKECPGPGTAIVYRVDIAVFGVKVVNGVKKQLKKGGWTIEQCQVGLKITNPTVRGG